MKLKIQFNEESIIKFLTLEILLTASKYYIIQSISGLYVFNDIANIVLSAILIIYLMPALITTLKRSQLRVLSVLVVSILVVVFQCLMFMDNSRRIIGILPKFFGMSIGCLITSYFLQDYKKLYVNLVKCSYAIIIFALVEFFTHQFLGVVGSETLSYDMSFGYFLVVPTALVFSDLFNAEKKKKIIDVVFLVLALLMNVVMGSRGGVIASVLAVVLVFFYLTKVSSTKGFLLIMVLIVVVVFIALSWNEILQFMIDFLSKRGINSRMLTMLASNRISWDAGRDELQQYSRKMIHEHPFFGIGMLGYEGSHNIFIELFLFYGIPLGIILASIVIFEWTKIFATTDKYKKLMMLIFFSYAVVDSMLNLTVLGKDIFWIYLGLAISSKFKFRVK